MSGTGEPRSRRPARIVGRDAALARLRGLVDPVPRASQVLLMTGEAGMGKTVLLADVAGRARSAGMRVLSVPAGSRSRTWRSPGCISCCGPCWPAPRAFPAGRHGPGSRRRRINDAKPVLTQALVTFRRLGARSWVQRAQAELRASGVSVAGAVGEPDALGELTPQQRQIVRLASDGLTDREIGDRLFLSPRTVSSHLYRSYPKLGVASRHQLRDVIARVGTPAAAHESTAGETRL